MDDMRVAGLSTGQMPGFQNGMKEMQQSA